MMYTFNKIKGRHVKSGQKELFIIKWKEISHREST